MFYVYIMASHRRVTYVGFCRVLEKRVWEHQHDTDSNSFTARYRVHKLVYFERWPRPLAGIAREKQVKAWSRAKKIALIEEVNPQWRDLSAGWGRPYREDALRPELGASAPPVAPTQTAPSDPSGRKARGRSG